MGMFFLVIFLLFAFFAVKGYMKGKISSTYSRFKEAEAATAQSMLDGVVQYPSWVNQNRLANQMALEIVQYAVKKGMTKEAALELFSKPVIRGTAATMAANLEKRGFSISEQIAGAAQFSEKIVDIQMRVQTETSDDYDMTESEPTTQLRQDGLDILLEMKAEAVNSDGLVQRGPIAFDDVERFYELYGFGIPTMWANEDLFRAAGRLVEFQVEGKCLVFIALTDSNTFMLAHRDSLPEITTDIEAEVVEIFQALFTQWVEMVPNISQRATQLS